MARVILSTIANESSPYFVRVTPTDEDGAAVTPTSAAYQLVDRNGTVLVTSTDIAVLATSLDIVLSGGQISIGSNGQVRILNVEYVYDSTLGSGLTTYVEAQFTIDDLVAL